MEMESESETESETETEMTEMDMELQIQEANRLAMELEMEMKRKIMEIDNNLKKLGFKKGMMTESQKEEVRRQKVLEYLEFMKSREKILEYEASDACKIDAIRENEDIFLLPTNFNLGYPDDLPPMEPPIMFYGKTKISSSLKMNVSSIAIGRFRERLLGGQERCTKKLVYLCVSPLSASAPNLSWLAIDGNDGPGEKEVSAACVDDAMTNPGSGFPSELTCYGCAVWNSSKIIIAGGKNCKGDPSDQVFIYDTFSKTWEPPLRMNATRGEKPTVIVADSKIFVFGGESHNLPWAEVYDDSSRSWYHLPAPDFIPKINSHAVYPRRSQILFWVDHCVVLSFNYRSWHWERYDKPMSIAVGPQWSAAVVVFEDFIIWHHFGTIYAHDLLNDVTIPMHTLPRTGFYCALFSSDVPPLGFLVHIGRGKLCLFYQVDNCVRYITFLVQISEGVGPAIPHTVVGRSGFLKTPPVNDVNHALEISS